MHTRIIIFIATLLLCISSNAETLDDIVVTDGWARSSTPPNNNSAAYMVIQNNSDMPCSIIGATAMDIANQVELHQSYVDDKGISRMTAVDHLVIPAKSQIELRPNGTHIMLMNLKHQLVADDKITINLIISNIGVKTVPVVVKALGQ